MGQLETKLDELLVKKAPFQLPANGKEGLVKAMPWITLLGGLLMLWAAWTLWQLVGWANDVANFSNTFSQMYGVGYVAPVGMAPLLWVSLAVLVVEAVMFFMAFPALQARKKSGWNLLFWVSLLNAAEAVVQAVGYSNMGSLIGSLIGSVIGLYLLFQIRSYYTGESKMSSTPTAQPPKETPPSTTPPAPEVK